MNLPCNIVRDMLVLYADDALSSESRSALEEHLENCSTCKAYLENIKKEKVSALQQEEIEIKARDYQKHRKKKIRITIISLVCAVIIGGWWLFTTATTNNPNIFETTNVYFQLYILGKGRVVTSEEPFRIYCEARYQISGTTLMLAGYGFENTGEWDSRKRNIMVKDNEVYYADIYDNRFISHAIVTKADISDDQKASIIEEYNKRKEEVSTGE